LFSTHLGLGERRVSRKVLAIGRIGGVSHVREGLRLLGLVALTHGKRLRDPSHAGKSGDDVATALAAFLKGI
jgi:hypothetical protein